MAYYDGLTGLYNRNYFVRLLTEYLRRAKEDNRLVSVLVIDIDDFRKVNDGLGIVAGDELVQQFGSFLKEFNSDDVIVCHLTSDVYCMAIYDSCGDRSVEHIHKEIVKRTREPFYLVGGQILNITVSVGVAEYPEAATSALELINCAEIVMFKGKSMGKNRIQYFDTPILNDFLKNVELDSKLKEAVFDHNFILYYQPQYYAGNQKLRGMEGRRRGNDQPGEVHSDCREKRHDYPYRQLGTGAEHPDIFRMEEPVRRSVCIVCQYLRTAVPEGRLRRFAVEYYPQI